MMTIIPIAAAMLLLGGCSRVPLDVKTDKTVVTLSNTYGLADEKSINVPNDLRLESHIGRQLTRFRR
jgi:hypothetical protein